MFISNRWTGAAALMIAATSSCAPSRVDVSRVAPADDGSTTPPVADASPEPGDASSPPPTGTVVPPAGPCKEGEYTGAFGGSYASPLAAGRLALTGTVSLSLAAVGPGSQTCRVDGEFVPCSNVFLIQDGTITGLADDPAMAGDAQPGGDPCSCTVSGALLCTERTLVNGWIQCTVCPASSADAGTACSAFAGPLAATYDFPTESFSGTWNGADALAGVDGGPSAADGGADSGDLSLDGGYSDGQFGGSGTWTAGPR